ncbi:CBS domain-containing protein [Streptomyces sp. NBC_00191]|uniref:CBS domain-containing protein n=1 Tax=Streptomyces sp. NBC_00191 TaxID=2975674 RepID=UPI0032460C96
MTQLRTVGDVMTHAVIAVGPDAPIKEMVESMRQWRISALPVLMGDGRVAGVVSEADLLVKAQGDDRSGAVTARQLMTAPAMTVSADATVAGAARLMARGHLKRLPVVDGAGHLVGVVSRGDLLKIYLRPDADIAEEVRSELVAQLVPVGSGTVHVHVEDGLVTLSGTVSDTSLPDVLARAARAVPGVVNVVADIDVDMPVL